MSKTARRAEIGATIKLLSERFPQTFNRRGPQPLKVGVYGDVLAALGEAVQPRDLQSALRAYTGNRGYLRAMSAGACRIDLDGEPAGTVTPEDETVAKAKLAESPRTQVPPPEAPAMRPAEENQKPSAPKRLSLADLREAGRRRREAAA
jgi:sRNA-binding protein